MSKVTFMLAPSEAVETAKRYLLELFPEAAEQIVRLEEIETPQRGGAWGVTLSITDPRTMENPSLGNLLGLNRRKIKLVELDHESGALLAVTNKAA
jgi:hypothetical protein